MTTSNEQEYAYVVEYIAVYWVKAKSEEEAIELAIYEHEDNPNGGWSAFYDIYNPDNQDIE